MQQWYALSDEAIVSMRLFAHLSLDGAIPDRTTIMNFRHLLEKHKLARKILKAMKRWLSESDILMKQGSLVDATIIKASSSTKNKGKQRDSEMHQTKKVTSDISV